MTQGMKTAEEFNQRMYDMQKRIDDLARGKKKVTEESPLEDKVKKPGRFVTRLKKMAYVTALSAAFWGGYTVATHQEEVGKFVDEIKGRAKNAYTAIVGEEQKPVLEVKVYGGK